MSTDFWIAFGSVATAIAVIVAFWAITQNRIAQRKEHKAELLGKIADWVIDIKNCPLRDIPFVKDITEEDLKNLKTSTEHNKLIMYFSLMVTGQYLRTLAITNNLGEQIVKNITETQKAVTRLWAVSNVLFGVTVKGIKDSMADTTKDFSDFLDELEKTDAKTLEDKLDSEAIVLASAGNNLLTEVCKKISAIFS